MQNDSGMSDYPLLALCRCQAVSRMMKTDVVCVVLMEVTKCRDARETVLPVYLVEGGARVLGKQHPRTLSAMNELIKLYETWGKPEKAEEWRAKLPKTKAIEQ